MYKIIGGDQRQYGPVSLDEVRAWIREGRANGKTLVQMEGSQDWKPLAEFPEFAEALAAKQTPKAPGISATPTTPATNEPAWEEPAAASTPDFGSDSTSFGSETPQPTPAAPSPPQTPARYIMMGADHREYGPVPLEEMRQWISEGRANSQTPIRREGSTRWQQIAQLPEFSQAMGAVRYGGAPGGGMPGYPSMPRSQTNQMALWGMICGILSLPCSCCGLCGSPFALAGLVLSGLALSQLSKNPVEGPSKGYAIAGLVLSILGLLLIIGSVIVGTMVQPEQIKQLQQFLEQLEAR